MKLIKMKCENCGATLDVNKSLEKITCNYCGAEILIDDEATKVKRVEDAKLKARQENHEQSLKERNDLLEQEVKEKKIKEELNSVDNFKKGKFSKILLIFFAIAVLFFFVVENSFAKILTIVQALAFLCAWLMGMKILKEGFKGLKVIIAIIGFVLIVPIINTGSNNDNKYEKLIWDDIVLNEIIPKPSLKKAEISFNDQEKLWINLSKADKSDYKKYIKECDEFGYTIDAKKDDKRYTAYDKKGNKLEVEYDDDDSEIEIKLEAAMEMKKGVWPTSNIAKLLPEPKSEKGHLEWENETSFLYYAADTSEEDFNDYVNSLKDKGFTVDFDKDDNYYYADNKDGYHVAVNLEGFDVMRIEINSPDEEETTTPEAEDKEESSDKENGMRKEFKEAMDSYEEFIDEYVSFIKKYSKSDGSDLELLKDYSEYVSKLEKMEKAFEKWEDEDLNSVEEAYYLKVQTRVSKKLLEVAQ